MAGSIRAQPAARGFAILITMMWLKGGRQWADGKLQTGGLALAGDRIVAFGDVHRRAAVDLTGMLVLPGLVNGHDHLTLNLFGQIAPSRPYENSYDWAADVSALLDTAPIQRLRAVPRPSRAWHGALKNALAGATTVVHHDPWLEVFRHPDFPITVPRIGWAHSLGLAGAYGPALPVSRREHSAGVPFYLHLAEGTDARSRAELTALAASVGLGPDLRLVHGVGMTPSDVARAVAAGAGLVWCPASNHFLLAAVADPGPFLTAGAMALGTDSRLTGSRDLLAEMATAARTGLASPAALLRSVTDDGARLCGRPAAGRLAVGAPADLVVLPDDGRPPPDQLVQANRADLRLVLARGRPVVADPDLAVVFERVQEPPLRARLDGREKLVARRIVAPLLAAGLHEPGLEILDPEAALAGWTGAVPEEAVVV